MADIETIDRVVDSEDARTRRLSMTSDGKFASGTFWIVVDDTVRISRKTKGDDGDAGEPAPTIDELLSHERCDGDQVDLELKNRQSNIIDLNLRRKKTEADNSARGLSQRYGCGIRKTNWNKIRKFEYDYRGTVGLETGSYAPLRVKVITVPEDKLADSCENYTEYTMKCELKGVKPPLGETEFKIYKY